MSDTCGTDHRKSLDVSPEGNAGLRHVAIIMDGNGRWAQQRGLPRLKGHEAGADSVRCAIESCRRHGIPFLTLYAFSVENWRRPVSEIRGLMSLLRRFLRQEEQKLHENQVRLRVIGRRRDLDPRVDNALRAVEGRTAGYRQGTLLLALSYGGRQELVDAFRSMAEKIQKGDLQPDAVNEASIREHLYAPDVPDPDLLIRTSGEMRLSNFLLWQLSYSELFITPTLWPDFRGEAFDQAVADFAGRQRRFGGVVSKKGRLYAC